MIKQLLISSLMIFSLTTISIASEETKSSPCDSLLDRCVKVVTDQKTILAKQEKLIDKQNKVLDEQNKALKDLESSKTKTQVTAISTNLLWLLIFLL